jgi:hypothetical protein
MKKSIKITLWSLFGILLFLALTNPGLEELKDSQPIDKGYNALGHTKGSTISPQPVKRKSNYIIFSIYEEPVSFWKNHRETRARIQYLGICKNFFVLKVI